VYYEYDETRGSDEQVDPEGMRPVWREHEETDNFCHEEHNMTNRTRKEANRRDGYIPAIRFQGNDMGRRRRDGKKGQKMGRTAQI